MAAATTVIAGSAALASAGLGIGQMISGANKKKDANLAINESVKELRGMIEEGQANRLKALQVPTMGSELKERALARATGGQVKAMQDAGVAGVIGGAGRLTQAAGEQAEIEAARIDQMQAQRDKLVLTEDQRLESQRYQGLLGMEQMELQGAQQAASDAMAQQQAGALGIGTSLGQLSSTFAGLSNPYGNQKTTSSGQKVGIRPAVTSGLTSQQPEFQSMHFDSSGQPYNPAYQQPTYGPLSGGMTTPTTLPSNFDYAALGYLGGNN